MQKVGAQYLAKRIANQLMTAPAQPAEVSEDEGDLDGQVFLDEEKQPVGTARRLADVAVYVVFDGSGDPREELERCLSEPESRVFSRAEDGRITGLIYAADPNRVTVRIEGTRVDDV